MVAWTASARASAAAGSRVAIAVTDPHARETAEAGAGSWNGSNRNKSGGRLGTKGRTHEAEMSGHEADRGRWSIVADGGRADTAVANCTPCSTRAGMPIRCNGAACGSSPL